MLSTVVVCHTFVHILYIEQYCAILLCAQVLHNYDMIPCLVRSCMEHCLAEYVHWTSSVCVHVHCPLIDTQDGLTPLMYAAALGRTDVVEELIKRGADMNAQDKVRCLRGYCKQWSRWCEVCWRWGYVTVRLGWVRSVAGHVLYVL